MLEEFVHSELMGVDYHCCGWSRQGQEVLWIGGVSVIGVDIFF